jgi:hypothetical protein
MNYSLPSVNGKGYAKPRTEKVKQKKTNEPIDITK